MASTTVFPNGDGSIGTWRTQAGGATNLYQTIDEGTTSPNDTDYITTGDDNQKVFLQLGDMPSDFDFITAITIKLRCRRTASKGDPLGIETVQIFQSDEVTALTSSSSVADSTTIATLTITPGITGSTGKTAWDGARLKVESGSGSDGNVIVYAAQIEITYTAVTNTHNETGSGGATGGGTGTVKNINRPTTSGGGVAGGGSRQTYYNVGSSNGVVANGVAKLVDDFFASGGAVGSGTAQIASTLNIRGLGGATGGTAAQISTLYRPAITGGSIGGGSALISSNETASGGAVLGGTSRVGRTLTEVGLSLQGTKLAGTALCPAKYNIGTSGGTIGGGMAPRSISFPITGGSRGGGTARVDIGIIGRGGVILTGGERDLDLEGSGGIRAGGTARIKITSNIQVFNTAPGGGSINTNRFPLTGSQMVPSVVSTSGIASAAISLDDEHILHWDIDYDEETLSDITTIKFHGPATSGATAAALFDIATYPTDQISVPLSQLIDVLAGNWYIQINTEDHPTGELRGQGILSGTKATISVIAKNITSTGGAMAGGTSTVSVVGVISGGTIASSTGRINCNFTIGSSGGVRLGGYNIFDQNGVSYHDIQGFGGVRLGGAATEAELYNVALGGGTTSGSATIFCIYQASDRLAMTGAQVVPPQTETNSASVSITLDSDNVIRWDIVYNGTESDITNIRFRGPAATGATGPVVLELGTISGLMMPNSGAYVLTDTLAASMRTDPYYVEIYADSSPILRSQIVLNGTGSTVNVGSDAPLIIIADGGVRAGGTARIINNLIINGSGGVRAGSTATVNKRSNMRGTGGAVVGGTPIIRFTYQYTVTGGGTVGGRGIVVSWVVAKGGATVGSAALVSAPFNIIPTGGISVGGAIKQQNFYLSSAAFGGAKVGGRSKISRLSETETVIKNISRVLNSENLLKDLELSLIRQIAELSQITDGPTPEAEDESATGEWCDVETRCEQGAVPKRAQDRQTILPPNKVTVR